MFPKMSQSSHGPSLGPKLRFPYWGRETPSFKHKHESRCCPAVWSGSGLAQGRRGQPTQWTSDAQQSGAGLDLFLPSVQQQEVLVESSKSQRALWGGGWGMVCDRTCLITPSSAIKIRFTPLRSCLSAVMGPDALTSRQLGLPLNKFPSFGCSVCKMGTMGIASTSQGC